MFRLLTLFHYSNAVRNPSIRAFITQRHINPSSHTGITSGILRTHDETYGAISNVIPLSKAAPIPTLRSIIFRSQISPISRSGVNRKYTSEEGGSNDGNVHSNDQSHAQYKSNAKSNGKTNVHSNVYPFPLPTSCARILRKDNFIVSYDQSKRIPYWVAETLTRESIKGVGESGRKIERGEWREGERK